MDSEETAFLQAIVAAPDDDLPRLVYADWLEERGNAPRADFIRFQVEASRLMREVCEAAKQYSTMLAASKGQGSASHPPGSAEVQACKQAFQTATAAAIAMQERIEANAFKPMLDALGIFDSNTTRCHSGPIQRILEDDCPANLYYERGFPKRIMVMTGLLQADARTPAVFNKHALMRILQEHPTIDEISLCAAHPGVLRNLFSHNPFTPQLKTMSLELCIDDAHVRELLQVGPFPNLQRLVVMDPARIDVDTLIALVHSPRFPRLADVEVDKEGYLPQDLNRLYNALAEKYERVAAIKPGIGAAR